MELDNNSQEPINTLKSMCSHDSKYIKELVHMVTVEEGVEVRESKSKSRYSLGPIPLDEQVKLGIQV